MACSVISLTHLEHLVQNASDAFDKLAIDDAAFNTFVARFLAHKINELQRRSGNDPVFEIK